MSGFFYWSGVVAWCLAAIPVAWLIGEAIWSAICAFSLTRWSVRIALRFGTFKWGKCYAVPGYWLEQWWELLGYRNNGSYSITSQIAGHYWCGVGDWTLPRKCATTKEQPR